MAQSNFAPGPPSHKGSIDFAVISEAWEIVKNNLGSYVVLTLLTGVVYMAVNMLISLPQTLAEMRNPTPAPTDFEGIMAQMAKSYTTGLPYTILTTIANSVIMGALSLAIAAMTIKVLQGQKPEIGDGFAAMKYLAPAAIIALISTIASQFGLLACIVGAFIVTGLFIPVYPILIHERLGVVDTIKRSFNLMGSHFLMAAVFALVQGLLIMIGAVLCCVPVLFTLPLALTCSTLIYRDVSGVSFSGEPQSATVYPREGGGQMPGYEDPSNDPTPPTDPNQ